MKTEKIPYEQTHRFSKIIIDYLRGEEKLAPFYNYVPEISSFQKVIDDKSKENINRSLLHDTLIKQYAKVSIKPSAEKNIDNFKDPKTFCVVTAHQLNIFTGPLYFIFKTLSTIKLCINLKKAYPAYNFIPVFWMGSEDHDFEEINHFQVYGKSYTWMTNQTGACGRFDPSSISSILDEIKPVFGSSENVEYLLKLFDDAYLNSKTLAQASRMILNELLGDYGLVVVDGDDKYFKSQCISIVEDELFKRSSEKIVNETLINLPYEVQAKPREINLFYLFENLRERIVYDVVNETYHVLNTEIHFSADELRSKIENNPEYFSPNVILRPLFQQKVLPSLAYIGGGGEIAYWLQLKDLFNYHKINFPVLLLRDSFLLIENNINKKIVKLNFNNTDIFKEENELIGEFVKRNSSDNSNMDQEIAIIEKEFEKIVAKALQVDPTLEKSVLAERQLLINSIQKLEAKLLKAEKNKMEIQVGQIRSLLSKLFPSGSLQERDENFIPYYFKYGKYFFELILDGCIQPGKEFTILSFDEEVALQ